MRSPASGLSVPRAAGRASFADRQLGWLEARQPHAEHRALAATLAVHGDRAAVRFHQLPGDRESQSQAREAPRAAAVGLAEFLEDVRQEFRGDAFAVVAHLAVGHVRVDAGGDRDHAVRPA